MNFYGSAFSNGRQLRPARHIACPQRLKYIHDIKDGFIPYVEDSGYINRSLCRSASQKLNRSGLYNTMDAWRQELMGLAQQVQSSLRPCDESQRFRSSRLTPRRPRRSNSSISTYNSENNDEQNITKQLLSRRASARYRRSYVTKPKTSIDVNESESSTNNEHQDSGIWLLPILCHILHVDNINEAQEWLVDANPTEKRLAMELISRTMYDLQNHESEILSDIFTYDQSTASSSLNNLYWPYKFWQHQQQSKTIMDNNDTCERATSPVRILTPAHRLSTPIIHDRPTTPAVSTRPNQTLQTSLTKHTTETRCPSSRLSTPMTANNSDRQPRQSYRITTSRSASISANLRGKTPLI